MSTRRWIIGGCITIWLGLALGGMGLLMASTYTPSPAADARPTWPAGLSIRPAAGKPTLVLCLHPRCPCSDATLDALQTLLERSNNKPTVFALLAMPASASADWTDNDLANRLRSMPGVTTVIDTGGVQCNTLGARSSGQTLAYDAAGRLAFVGGLTPGRGESGPCQATVFLQDWLAGRAASEELFKSHVFGCALYRAAGVRQ